MATHSGRLGSIGQGAATTWFCLAAWFLATASLQAQVSLQAQSPQNQFDEYDLAMFDRPKLSWNVEPSVSYGDGLKELWARALERPDPELQRLVIDTLALAHQRGVQGIGELKPKLVEMAKVPNQSLDVVRSLAMTLIALDARDQDQLLADLATQYGATVSQIVEPAIAQWESPVLEQVWLDRVNGPAAGTAMVVLAIEGLAAIESEQAAEPLTSIVRNAGERSQLRMAAAGGLGRMKVPGLIDLANELAALPSQPAALHPILAVRLLTRQTDSQATELLTGLLDRESTAVQSEALAQLYRIDFNLVDVHRDKLLTSRDVNVRRWCLKALVDKKQEDRVELICRLLDDVNPTLRRDAAASLVALATDAGFGDVVISETSKVLAQNNWRGCEQACVVLTRLDHKASGRRMVELLGHQRGDVQVAAAWGLSKLRIQELLPDMLDHAQSVYEGFRSGELNDSMPGASLHVAHLFIAFGDQNHAPAEPLMRRYMPKNFGLGLESRAAAAWALGMLHVGDPQPDLVSVFLGRIHDNGIEPDTDEIRSMSAISLGRMQAESALPDLRELAVGGMLAFYWAIEQMTGEKPPEPSSERVTVDDWFLAPLPGLPK